MQTVKSKILSCVYLSVAVAALVTAFCSAMDFTFFLSVPSFYAPPKLSQDENNTWLRCSWSLFVDTALISLFILQHSLMATPLIKRLFASLKLQAVERNIYVIFTSLALQVLVRNWQATPEVAIWKLLPNRYTWWLLVITHVFLWMLIYVGNICADVNELLGLKQVYYYLKGLPGPNQYKSPELQRLNNHMRHPSFLALVLLFWISPTMSLDRFLLASLLSSYMYLAWNTDNMDFRYQESQYRRKFYELQRL